MMARMLNILLTLTLLSVSWAVKNPGLKLRISQKGLDYGAGVAIDQLSGKVVGQKIPDKAGEARVPIGKIKYWLTNMAMTSFSKPTSKVTLSPGSGLTWAVAQLSASLHGDWKYEYKKAFIKIKDHGSFDVDVTASLTVSVTLGKDTAGHPTITTTSCQSAVSRLKVKFHGGASWLYNLFSGSVAKSLKGDVSDMLCKAVNDEVNVDANKALAKMKVQVPLRSLGVLDYSLTQSPSFTTAYLESLHKGEVFWKGDTEECPLPSPVTNDPPLGGMVSFLASDYILNSAGYILQKHNILKYNLTKKDLPASSRDLLNTTCSSSTFMSIATCIGLLIPQLPQKYPNSAVEVFLETATAPTLSIDNTGLSGAFLGKAIFNVRTPDGGSAYAFTVNLTVSAEINVTLDRKVIKASVEELTPKFKVIDSKIGNIPDVSISFLFNLIKAFVMKELNDVGTQGMPLPSIDNVEYVNPSISLIKDAIYFATDLQYKPTTLYFQPNMVYVSENTMGRE